MDPPLVSTLAPAVITRRPPADLSPPSSFMLTLPPLPLAADVVLITIDPLLPLLDVPEERCIDPLVPDDREFSVETVKDPLLDVVPKPDKTEIEPPLLSALSPPASTTRPEADVSEAPKTTLIDPPEPLSTSFVYKAIAPLFPSFDFPDTKAKEPLIPPVPAPAVITLNEPLDVADPNELDSDTEPPVELMLSPAAIMTRPPAPTRPLPTVTLRLPPVPEVADPVRRTTEPLLPLSESPDANAIDPDIPP